MNCTPRFFLVAFWVTCCPFFFTSLQVKAQRLLFDTLVVDFIPDTLVQVRGVNIRSITDSRNENPCFVRYIEKKKYLLLPADLEVYTRNPLAGEIGRYLVTESKSDPHYSLDITKFQIVERKSKLGKGTFLEADLQLYRHQNDSAVWVGTFYYDYSSPERTKKEPVSLASQKLLSRWHRDLKLDLLLFNARPADGTSQREGNFISDPNVRPLYLITRSACFVGRQGWGMQGELFFSRPETRAFTRSTSGIIRYKNTARYESFALGRTAEHFQWRLVSNWVFESDMNLLLGVCKWKDIEVNRPKLQQLFETSLSSVQSLNFSPKNSRTLTGRIGLMEDVSYIIDRRIQLQLGLFLGMGFKI